MIINSTKTSSRGRYFVHLGADEVATFRSADLAIDYARWLSFQTGKTTEVSRPAACELYAQFNCGVANAEFSHLNTFTPAGAT
jgi:hypothetical protein